MESEGAIQPLLKVVRHSLETDGDVDRALEAVASSVSATIQVSNQILDAAQKKHAIQ